MKLRLTLGVALAWLLAGVVLGAQAALGTTMRGADPIPLSDAMTAALRQTLPWIPVTLAIVALTVRWPLSRQHWMRHLPVHLAAAPALALAANVLVVLGHWATSGTFGGVGTLVRQGAVWATVHFLHALVIYAVVLALTQAVLFYRETRARELRLARVEGQLARAQVQALTAQIRPHFLFNTLHTIGQLWRSGRSDDADAVLDHLGALFHRVQQSTSQPEVPLAEELALVREYLAIEAARFRDRLHTTITASDEALDCLVPPLILQPLVENAIRHGVSAVSTATRVEVRASVHGGLLILSVRDDGPGMRAVSPQPGSGTGLRNTRERLAQLHGADAGMLIDDAPGGGTIVTIELPRVPSEPGRFPDVRQHGPTAHPPGESPIGELVRPLRDTPGRSATPRA